MIIHIDQEDSDWNDAKWDWSSEITCAPCAAEYSVTSFFRGAALMRKSDLERSQASRREAAAIEAAFVASSAVANVLEKLVGAFAARTTMVARHQLARELGVEPSAIGTFRKYQGGKSPRQLVDVYYDPAFPSQIMHRLLAAFGYVGHDAGLLERCRAQADALRDRADDACVPVMTLAASLGAAIAGGRGG